MQNRYGSSWLHYKNNVPSWLFLWKPKAIPRGVVYFDMNCTPCTRISKWFTKANSINLDIKPALEYPNTPIENVTYVDHTGVTYQSVKAIAHALEHINLAYASLGWFMRFPIITNVLQLIVNSMNINQDENSCHL